MVKSNKDYHSQSLSILAKKRFISNPLGLIPLIVVLTVATTALAGYLITPDNTPFANRQLLEISTQKPGFNVTILSISVADPPASVSWWHRMLYGQPARDRWIPLSDYDIVGDSVIGHRFDPDNSGERIAYYIPFLLSGKHVTDHGTLSRSDRESMSVSSEQPANDDKVLVKERRLFSHTYWLGTDQFGRDLLSRLIIGARVSLSVGIIAVAISLILGLFLGSVAGYFRGRTDQIILWFINVVWSIPTLLLVIALTFALGRGFWQVFLAVGLTMWVEVARVVRGQIMGIREKEFVEAGRALGFRHGRILWRHILPNVINPVIVISAANFASAILIEAGLSFLGIGVQPPMPSWGSMVKEYYSFIILDAAYLAIIPGIAIVLLVLAFLTLGNALQDALDVKLK